MIEEIKQELSIIRKTKPLILNVTNYVTMDFTANCLLGIGASPIMSEDIREIEELVQISSAININIGTLTSQFLERVMHACNIAKQYNKPIIFDPVGVGVSKIRSNATVEILPFIDILRGNASEIMAIYDLGTKGLGVDTSHAVDQALEAARALARQYNITVIISGEIDFITDGTQEIRLSFGSYLMPLLTGTGCSLTAVIAGFRAVVPNSFTASTLATMYYSLAGQIAGESASGPASFKVKFIDHLYQPNWPRIREIYAK